MANTMKFTVPKLVHFNYDVTEDWYVYFRYLDESVIPPKRRLKQLKGGINYFKNKAERKTEASAFRTAIENKLRQGWNPFTKEYEEEKSTLVDILADYHQLKLTQLKREPSRKTYSTVYNLFTDWLNKSSYKYSLPEQFTNVHAQEYMDYFMKSRNPSSRTYNNHISFLRIYFNMLVDREVIRKNPFSKIPYLKTGASTKNMAFSDAEAENIWNYLFTYNRDLYYYTKFMYFTYIRRSELCGLKISAIDLHNKTIRISAAISKNGKDESVVIPEPLEQIIAEMKLINDNPEHYIFGHGLVPGPNRILNLDRVTRRMETILKKLEMPKGKTLYSFKHYGVCKAYNFTNGDIYSIMTQCRHHSIEMTMIYLKTLGLSRNDAFRNAMK